MRPLSRMLARLTPGQRRWDAEEDRRMLGLYDGGLSYRHIGERLARSKESIKARVDVLILRGVLARRDSKHWAHKKPEKKMRDPEAAFAAALAGGVFEDDPRAIPPLPFANMLPPPTWIPTEET